MKKEKRTLKQTVAIGLCTILLTGLAGCGSDAGSQVKGQTKTKDLMSDYKSLSGTDQPSGNPSPAHTPASSLPDADVVTVTDFGVRLLQNLPDTEENILLSPLSVINALTMTANGADGETLSQMEAALGANVASLSSYLHDYNTSLPEGEKYRFHLANSLWIKDMEEFAVEEDFLRTNADLLKADIFKTPFDAGTLRDINDWVSENTDEMIPNILNEIPKDAVMYLINAIAFDAEWQNIYKENRVRDGQFTKADGTKQDVKMMYSDEHTYLSGDGAQGFLKYYADGKYAFAALLPDEGVDVKEYVDSLDGEGLHDLLSNTTHVTVNAGIPRFKTEYASELNVLLQAMGMEKPFIEVEADFSALGHIPDHNIYISRVLHKTYIAVDEKGTKAGAATVVEMQKDNAAMMPEEIKTVYLDRPFVYMIIDCEECLPIFIGIVRSVEEP